MLFNLVTNVVKMLLLAFSVLFLGAIIGIFVFQDTGVDVREQFPYFPHLLLVLFFLASVFVGVWARGSVVVKLIFGVLTAFLGLSLGRFIFPLIWWFHSLGLGR